MRTVFAYLALLMVGRAGAQDLGKPVTYTTKAIPFHIVLENLSKQSGVTLKTTSDLEEEPLILRLEKVPLQEAMDKMAEVFAADWVDHHGFWRLERSDAKIAKLREARFEKRKASIEQSLEKVKAFQQQHPLDAQGADAFVNDIYALLKKEIGGESVDGDKAALLDAERPASRLSTSILAAMDPAELAAIPLGKRVVFSTAPDQLQKPLPEMTESAFDECYKETALIEAAVNKDVPQEHRQMFTSVTRGVEGRIARVVVSASAELYQNDIQFDLTYMDANGKVVAQDFQSLGFTPTELNDALKKFLALRRDAMKDGFYLDAIAMEIAPFTVSQPPGQIRPLSAPAQDFLLHPTTYDPVSLATSQIILKTAEIENVNAICLPTDQAEFYALNSSKIGKTNLAAFQSMAETMCNMSITKGDGWLVGMPDDPQLAAGARLPRPLLERFIQSAYKRGYVSIDDGADLCGGGTKDTNIQLARRYVSYLMPEKALDAMWEYPSLLRAFGLLTQSQRDAAARDKLVLNVSDLSADQREGIQSFIFDPDNPPAQFKDQAHGPGSFDTHDRTDFLPTGLRDDLQVEVTDVTKPVFYAQVDQNGSTSTMTVEPDLLAGWLAQSEHPELFDIVGATIIKKLSSGSQRELTIKVLDGGRSIEGSAQEEHRPTEGMLPIDEFLATLPKDQREQIETAVGIEVERRREFQADRPSPAPPPASGVKPPVRR